MDYIAGLNLNYRKCCWVQYGTEERESHWLSENCGEFREMQIVKHAKHVGTMIGPDGHIHRWTAHWKNHPAHVEDQCFNQKTCGSTLKIYAILVLSFSGSVCAHDKATLKGETQALQCTTAGPYNAIPFNLLGECSVCGLGLDLVGIHSIGLEVRYRAAACSTTLDQGIGKIQAYRGITALPFSLSHLTGRAFLCTSWLVASRMLSVLFVAWTMVANLMKPRRIRSTTLPFACIAANYLSKILLDPSHYGPPKFWDQSAIIEWQTFCFL